MTYAIDASRVIDWSAGSDQWNGGSLPTYSNWGSPTGLTQGDGTTDNTTAINNALTAAASVGSRAVTMPAGIYYVNGQINIPSNTVLRGAAKPLTTWLPANDSANTTILKLGPGGFINIADSNDTNVGGFDWDGHLGAEIDLATQAGNYEKGDTSIVLNTASHGYQVNDWIGIAENRDSTLDPTTPPSGDWDWFGDSTNAGVVSNPVQQFARITSVAGATIGISRPMYYTYISGSDPTTRKITWQRQYAGLENIRLNGWSASRQEPFIWMQAALYCWVKGVETYNAPNYNKAAHVRVDGCHGCEIRDSYFHTGRDSSSDTNYGIVFFCWNSDHKVENNILRCHRHSIVFEGGGSGCAMLYNYIDDNWSDDSTYCSSARTNHGPHPYYNMWEGNVCSHLESDDVFSGCSYTTYFRNHLRGANSEDTGFSGNPSSGFFALDIRGPSRYHTAVGNVLGMPAWTGQGYLLRPTSSSQCDVDTCVYYVGCQDSGDYGTGYDASCWSTCLVHGNYDYITDGVAYWNGGADHDLADSLYYDSKPSFLGSLNWPPIGPDVTSESSNDDPFLNTALYVWLNGAEPPSAGDPPTGTITVFGVR